MSFLPFGSNDASVELQETLTANSGVMTEIGSPTYNSGGVSCGAGEGLTFAFDSSAELRLQAGWQITCQLPTKFFGTIDSPNNSEGFVRGALEFLMTFAANAGDTDYLRVAMTTGNQCNFRVYDEALRAIRVSTWEKSTNCIFAITGNGTTYDAYIIDERYGPIAYCFGVAYTSNAGLFTNYWHMTNKLLGQSVESVRTKNLQIASQYAGIPFTSRVICDFGDSMVNLYPYLYHDSPDTTYSQTSYDAHWPSIIAAKNRQTYNKGLDIRNFGYGGHYVSNTARSSGLDLKQYRPTMLAANPNIVIFPAGTNDVKTSVGDDFDLPADFESSLEEHITTILAVAEYMVLCTIPTTSANSSFDNAKSRSNTAQANQVYYDKVQWWNTNNPDRIGALIVYDRFTDLGGESPSTTVDSTNFEGFQTTLQTDLHITAQGNSIQGLGLWNTLNGSIDMASIGNTDFSGGVGRTVQASGCNTQDTLKTNSYVLGADNSANIVSEVRVYAEGAGTGQSESTIRLYDASDLGTEYEPNNLLGESNSVAIPISDPAAWRSYTFSTPIQHTGPVVAVINNGSAHAVRPYIAGSGTGYYQRNTSAESTDPWTPTTSWTDQIYAIEIFFSVAGGGDPNNAPTTPRASTLTISADAALTGGISKYTYSGGTRVSSTDVVATDFWAGITKHELRVGDLIDCQLSDGYFVVSMTSETTGVIVQPG